MSNHSDLASAAVGVLSESADKRADEAANPPEAKRIAKESQERAEKRRKREEMNRRGLKLMALALMSGALTHTIGTGSTTGTAGTHPPPPLHARADQGAGQTRAQSQAIRKGARDVMTRNHQ